MNAIIGSLWSFGFNFAPYGWAQCNGQLLPIAQYQALYSLIGTTYGGDGQTSFGLPNLQGRTPIGTGQGLGLPNYVIGQAGGAEAITLTSSNMPVHTHALLAAQIPVGSTADSNDPTNNYFGPVTPTNAGTAYDPANNGVMAAGNTNSGITGGGAPFSIMSPYLVVNYCISLEGIYPQRN